MICIPIGKPLDSPAGTDAAGWPVKLTKKVMAQPRRGSISTPLIELGPTVLPSLALSTGGQAVVGVTSRPVLGKNFEGRHLAGAAVRPKRCR